MAKRKRRKAGVLGRRLPRKIAKGEISPKSLRFGKRIRRQGKYYQEVRDQNNKLVGRVRWYQKVKEDVRRVVEVKYETRTGKAVTTKRGRQRLGIEVAGWSVEKFDVDTSEVLWSRRVWEGSAPIGEPGGRVRGPQRGRTGRWLGQVFEDVDPVSWIDILRKLPSRLRQPDASNFRLRIFVVDRDGNEHYVVDPTQRLIQGLRNPGQFRDMLAAACSLAARRFGYAGAVELIAIDLLMGGEAA